VKTAVSRRRHYFYVTAPGPDRIVVDGRLRRVPTWVGHAKETGTLLTACGLNASSWPKSLDQHFRSLGARACVDCAAVVKALRDG
jgi:hypothetical protein